MADGYVQVAPDSTGKKIDNAELTRADKTVVERQRVVLGSDENPSQQVSVAGEKDRTYIYVHGPGFEEISEKLQMIIDRLDLLLS